MTRLERKYKVFYILSNYVIGIRILTFHIRIQTFKIVACFDWLPWPCTSLYRLKKASCIGHVWWMAHGMIPQVSKVENYELWNSHTRFHINQQVTHALSIKLTFLSTSHHLSPLSHIALWHKTNCFYLHHVTDKTTHPHLALRLPLYRQRRRTERRGVPDKRGRMPGWTHLLRLPRLADQPTTISEYVWGQFHHLSMRRPDRELQWFQWVWSGWAVRRDQL